VSHKIRTTIQPDVELEVEDNEYRDLKAMGLVESEETPEQNEVPEEPSATRQVGVVAREGK